MSAIPKWVCIREWSELVIAVYYKAVTTLSQFLAYVRNECTSIIFTNRMKAADITQLCYYVTGLTCKKSAVYLHLLSRPDCLGVYDDSHFSVLCRARYVQQLKVLEAVCIRIHKPVLCKQKEHVVALKL